jgi:hypothetical protein
VEIYFLIDSQCNVIFNLRTSSKLYVTLLKFNTEAITMVQVLISQSPDIQKVLAFDGAFEKLFNIVTQEGGVEGGAVANAALTCVDGLLRFNTPNQVGSFLYFRMDVT